MSYYFNGTNDLFRLIEDVLNGETLTSKLLYDSSFPPVNAYINNETKDQILSFALAGYTPEQIEVTVEGEYLVIKLDKASLEKDGYRIYQRGIKTSQCKKAYLVDSRYWDLSKIAVTFKNGLLDVFIPAKENIKPVKVQIG